MKYFIFVFMFFFGLASNSFAKKTVPMQRVFSSIEFSDDLFFENMLLAIKRQKEHFGRIDLNESLNFAGRSITRHHLYDSLIEFEKYVIEALDCKNFYQKKFCLRKFNQKMNQAFEVYQPLPEKWEQGFQTTQSFFTAYYSPDFSASFQKDAVYKNPIYGLPQSLKLRQSTSDEINFEGVLANKGLELLYVKESLYDIWLLHVEGGGRAKVRMADGSLKTVYLSYAASNKQRFQMLYKYMLAQGMLKKGAASIAKQRHYFENNPQDQRRILRSCPSYIYFKITESEPLGVQNIPLTQNRSLATDYRRMKEYGVINFIKGKKPVVRNNRQVSKIAFSRFFLNQDTGGAIKGNARCDLYFGYGKDAELAANHVYGLGEQYFLILK